MGLVLQWQQSILSRRFAAGAVQKLYNGTSGGFSGQQISLAKMAKGLGLHQSTLVMYVCDCSRALRVCGQSAS